jgi:hypothetical protein
VASWIDTEGTLSVVKRLNGRWQCSFHVAQKERSVLETLANFIRSTTGKWCGVYFAKKANAYYARWSSKEAVEKTIRETEPFLRTERRLLQYSKAKQVLPTIMTELEQRRLAAAKGREALRKKRLLKATESAA